MKRIIWLLLVLLVVGLGGFAQDADPSSGGNFLKECKVVLNNPVGSDMNLLQAGQAMACLGYISGFTEAIYAVSVVTDSEEVFCRPDESNNEQMVRVVVKWLEDHPEKLHMPRGFLVLLAFSDAFPCPDQE